MSVFFKLSFFFLLLFSSLEASEFYALIIGDTSEKAIASLVKSDIKHMKEEVRRIAKYTGMHLKIVVLKGSRLTLENVRAVFDQLHPGPDDTVLFFQSSHGFRTEEKKGKWPILFLNAYKVGIDFESINKLLLSKKPRLLVSIVNACNSVMPKELMHSGTPDELVLRSKAPLENMTHAYQQLFLHSKGAIIASSSKPKQESFGIDNEGSFFATSFLYVLNKAVYGEIDANWQTLMNEVVLETKRLAKAYRCAQRPQFMILEDSD